MKRITSFIITFTLLLCPIVFSINAFADDTSNTEWAGIFNEHIHGPLSEEQIASYPNNSDSFEIYDLEVETYETIPDEIRLAIIEEIDSLRTAYLANGENESDVPTGEVFIKGLAESLEPGYCFDFIMGPNNEHGEGFQDYAAVIRGYDGEFIVVSYTRFVGYPDDGNEVVGVSPTDPAETEPAPDETEKLPGTGTTEPVAAPKTADPIAVITAVLALSLTACAAVFTVVKEKSR